MLFKEVIFWLEYAVFILDRPFNISFFITTSVDQGSLARGEYLKQAYGP